MTNEFQRKTKVEDFQWSLIDLAVCVVNHSMHYRGLFVVSVDCTVFVKSAYIIELVPP